MSFLTLAISHRIFFRLLWVSSLVVSSFASSCSFCSICFSADLAAVLKAFSRIFLSCFSASILALIAF